jgi:hypothetical protein
MGHFAPRVTLSIFLLLLGSSLHANPPIAQYLFPAGGRQGTLVDLRIGGIDLNKRCGFEMTGPGIQAPSQIDRTKTIWFEGPLLPLPESQQQEDYPQDMAGKVTIAADAPLGVRFARTWTSQGTSPALKFMVGDLPEVIEHEIDGEPVPEEVKLPVTANGRIFPREDIDLWQFEAKRGQTIWCEVHAARLGSPLDSLIEILDPKGRVLAENDDIFGSDSFVRFTAAEDGKYQVRIRDVNFRGGQAYVYRLTISAGPRVDRVYPLGAKRGGKSKFEVAGSGLAAGPIEINIPADAPRDFSHRVAVGDTRSNAFLLDIDDLPEFLEGEPNDEPGQTKPVTAPAVLNGRIDKPGDRDCWAITMKKGETLEFDVRAQRLGSPLLPVLTVRTPKGDELQGAEGGQGDPSLKVVANEDGTYYATVADRFRNRGGPEFAYRLRVDKPRAPGFRLQALADSLTVARGAQAPVKLQIERFGGFNAPIDLTVEGLPADVTLSNPKVAANQANVDLLFKAGPAAKVGLNRLTITGTGKVGDQMLSAKVAAAVDRGVIPSEQVCLAVALPTPFKIKGDHDFRWAARGSVFGRRYQIERTGYDGPIEITLADRQGRHLQGVTAAPLIVPAGAKEFDYSVHLPPWMEMGRTCRVCVSGSAVVKEPDGSEHTVSFSSIQPSEQLIAVIGPERLGLEAEKTALVAAAGKTIELPLKFTRGKDLQGAVKVEVILPAHLRGVSADAITIAADKNSGTLQVRFADKLGPFNAPLIVRATAMEKGSPVVAEVKVELLTE